MQTLKDTQIGTSVRVESVGGDGALRQHFLDMGIIPGTEVTVVKLAPLGDPMELRLHGYELTLRLEDAAQIEVEPVQEGRRTEPKKHKHRPTEHPGLGEGGRFHAKGDGKPLPEGTTMRFALVGNQNSGKTTLFPRCDGGPQGWHDQGVPGCGHHRPARHLFHVALQQ